MLVMLVTTIIALGSAGAAMLYTDVRDNRAAWAEDLHTEAGILALSVTPALQFNDPQQAQQSLNALTARESIHAAALYVADGTQFAQYMRPGQPPPPPEMPRLLPGDGVHIDGERVLVMKPVSSGGEVLGTIYLRAWYDVEGRINAYFKVLGVVSIIGLLAAMLAASWLHRVVTRPMESMASVAQSIVEKRDYSFRAEKMTDDEVGVVIDAFNKMLDEVQAHARALETSEKLYRAIGESINYGVWVSDAQGRAIYISDSFLRLVGLTMEQAANDGWGSVMHPDDLEETMAAWKECARTGNNWYREHRMLGVDGTYHSILAQGTAHPRRRGAHPALGRHQSRHQPPQEHRARTARSRPPQGRIPRDARARAAQSAGADPQCRTHPRFGCRRRPPAQVGSRSHRAAGAAHVAAAR